MKVCEKSMREISNSYNCMTFFKTNRYLSIKFFDCIAWSRIVGGRPIVSSGVGGLLILRLDLEDYISETNEQIYS